MPKDISNEKKYKQIIEEKKHRQINRIFNQRSFY